MIVIIDTLGRHWIINPATMLEASYGIKQVTPKEQVYNLRIVYVGGWMREYEMDEDKFWTTWGSIK